MLSYTELTKGVLFIYEDQPYEVLESHFLRMQQRKAVVQTKIRNLITGKILDRNWQASDNFEEAEIERKPAIFIYERRPPAGGQEYWFHEEGNPRNRFQLPAETIGPGAQFLKPNTKVTTMLFQGEVINVSLPVKMDFMVKEAPPAIRGNTAQGGSKQVVLENGAKISVPLFVNEGDVVRVNTETGEYTERVEKK